MGIEIIRSAFSIMRRILKKKNKRQENTKEDSPKKNIELAPIDSGNFDFGNMTDKDKSDSVDNSSSTLVNQNDNKSFFSMNSKDDKKRMNRAIMFKQVEIMHSDKNYEESDEEEEEKVKNNIGPPLKKKEN